MPCRTGDEDEPVVEPAATSGPFHADRKVRTMPQDVVDLITSDHREFERMFDILTTQPDRRALTLPQLTALLVAHQRAEETEVYPVARDEAGEAEDVEHSDEEHERSAQLLQQLRRVTDLRSTEFDDLLSDLVDDVRHHASEEESTVLAGMRKNLDEARRHQLGSAFAARRAAELERGDTGIDPAAGSDKADLDEQARRAGIAGRSQLSKRELADRLKNL